MVKLMAVMMAVYSVDWKVVPKDVLMDVLMVKK